MSACGCCSGVTERTPLEVRNRPGLSAIGYRIGTHPDFLASLLAGLTHSARPRLAGLGTRERDDFSIALLDSWAVTADVLTFYSERLAQESYLRTARERISLQELGRLIGYQLRPGVAAETHLAFALEPPPGVPPGLSRDPGTAPPVTPAEVVLEPGLRVQSIPGPGEQPQTFETVETVEARPEWNALAASLTKPFVPGLGATHAYLQGAALNLKPGDAFLLAGSDVLNEHWDLRLLSEVEVDAAAERTLVRWAEPLGSLDPYVEPANPPEPFVLRKRVNIFGHNAPMWLSMSEDFRENYPEGDLKDDEWPLYKIGPLAATVDLDGSHPDVVPGSWIVLSTPAYRELWRVRLVDELSRAEFATSGKVTRLTLEAGENYDEFDVEVRETTVLAVSEPLTLAEAPDESDVEGGFVEVDVDVSAMRPGRRLLVRGLTASGEEHAEAGVLDQVQKVAGRWRLVLADDLATAYDRTTVVVHGNVALATHGETVRQLLGSGRAAAAFQRFALAHDPLTYTQSTDPSGADSALEVRVNDVRWDELPTLYGAGPRDRAYAVRTDEQGATYVQFGDGERGARLPTGSTNVRARYRKGLGAAGNVGAGALAQLLDRPLGAKGVSNPLAAGGGVDPEGEESARASIPLAMRTLGRAVSLLDYEDFARAFAGVAKAHAAVLPLRGGRTVVVTVALSGASGQTAADRLDDLAETLRAHGDPRVQVAVLEAELATFRLALRVAVDPAYEQAVVLTGVEGALRAAYSFEARGSVEPVFRSEVTAAAHTVRGVLAVDIDRLYAGATPGLAERLLAQQPAVGAGGVPVPAGLLLLDPAPLDWLEALP
ncbi:MAG: baseplate J/gp47 family protein [Gaiellaceae bacterium]